CSATTLRPPPAPCRYNLGLEWVEPYRAQRIKDLLTRPSAGSRFTPDDFARIQWEAYSRHRKGPGPLPVRHARPQSDPDTRALDVLKRWTFNTSADSAAA